MNTLLVLLLPLADPTPADNDVTAGGAGFAVFAGLIVMVAILCWSFSRRLKVARANMAREDAEAAEEAGESGEDSAGKDSTAADAEEDAPRP